MQKASITLIVSTYNRPDFLRLVLDGIADQSNQHFELILADDGSTHETKSCIDDFSTSSGIEVIHVWHEDHGFRKSAILNKAINASANEYLVFLDGDCIPRKHFIAEHRSLAKKGHIVGCSRLLLDQTITQHILDNHLYPHRWTFYECCKLRLSGHINRVLPLLKVPIGFLRSRAKTNWKQVRGCNFGIYKEDIINIGGFDESFTGWGYEDSELVARAINNQIYVRRGDYLGTVFHLWHPVASREEADSNQECLRSTIASGRKRAISSSIDSA